MSGRHTRSNGTTRRRQRGVVLVTVVIIGGAVTALFAGIVAYLANAEGNAISASLLKVRAHWAMVGHANYLRARVPRVARNLEAAGFYPVGSQDTLPEVDNFQSILLVAPEGYDLGGTGVRVAWNATTSAIGACPGVITSLDPIDATNVTSDSGQDYSTLDPNDMAQCILEELSTAGLTGVVPAPTDFAHGRCWHYQEYSMVIGARSGANARPNDGAESPAVAPELAHTAQGGLTVSFRLERVSTGLVAGEVGAATPCGSDGPAPPFVQTANLQNIAADMHVAVGYKRSGTSRAGTFTDYWRQ